MHRRDLFDFEGALDHPETEHDLFVGDAVERADEQTDEYH